MAPSRRPGRRKVAVAAAVMAAVYPLLFSRKRQGPKATTSLNSNRIERSILHGSGGQFWNLFRMNKSTFYRLVNWLRVNAGLRRSRDISAEKKVLVVLWIFAHATVQRNTASRFGLCQATVCRIVDELLPMFVILHTEFVRLPEDN